jgi:hypothetical protein
MLLYHFILLSCGSCLVGAKAQYYPISPPQSQELNGDRPAFNILNLPIRTLENYWKIIERLEAVKGTKTQYTAIVRETGISGLPICAASPAFSHPYFFPLDPFHLFYENCMPHFWDMWTGSSSSEVIHMSEDIASKLGAEAESAIVTLPSSFCGPIRDIFKK